ncbi:hypothetical protein RB195_001431 [Necator americanus]|uniref:Uncharacterized protein n=1 Tax=Necator americanus TaxID=51031 RepID=A0ABR1DE94_NECAM
MPEDEEFIPEASVVFVSSAPLSSPKPKFSKPGLAKQLEFNSSVVNAAVHTRSPELKTTELNPNVLVGPKPTDTPKSI